jgi:CobQ-like glutamine amidotransferase family enzyme
MLGASIHYPLRGAVTWKSIVGTNVASDALSNLASPGVLGGALDRGAQLFAVCAGLQILGESFPGVSGEIIAGLGMVPIVSLPGKDRIVGEVLVHSDLFTEPLTGFENHRGRTDLGGLSPLGRVLVGVGNGGEAIAIHERVDGLVAGNILATYLHGPALVRNPVLADHLLSRVVGALPEMPEGEEIAELLALDRRRALGAANFGK